MMTFSSLISGGKDSLFNMLQCIAAGHEVIAVANIEPENKAELDSYMYQSVGHEAVSLVAGALGLPIFRQKTKGKALCKRKNYVGTSQDEVEDLYELLGKVMKKVNIEGVSVGAIASDYQRTRVENVCSRLGLKCFAYLWKRDQAELLQEMIDAGLDAILIKVASIGLHPDLHLGMHIKDLQAHLADLNKKFGVNICGEGGEYETLTLDCPLFHRFITITESEKVVLSDDAFAPVGFLNVKNATLDIKSSESDDPVQSLRAKEKLIRTIIKNPYSYVQDCVDEVSEILFPQKPQKQSTQDLPFPFEVEGNQTDESAMSLSEYWKKSNSSRIASQIRTTSSNAFVLPDTTNCNLNYLTGWCCIGNVTGSNLMNALQCLKKHLERINYEIDSLVFVNLFVRDMSEFVTLNSVYSEFMPEVLPPARVCVETDLPPEIGALMNVIAHKYVSKSQKKLNPTNFCERDAIHVQSISHWAPANIGPYSQCIKIGGIYYLAGQIPLIPGTMEILNKPIFHQCRLALRHVLRVLQAMNETLTYSNILQAICYVTAKEIACDILALWSYIVKVSHTPVTVIVVSKLPKNAQIEWEVLACNFENPQVNEEVESVEDYSVYKKRCVYKEPFTSSLVCKISFLKKGQKRILKLVTPTGIDTVLKNCIQFMRTDFKTVGTPLCMLKLYYKASESSVARNINEIVNSFAEFKVVITVIPVVECENSDIFLTVTGICH